MKRYLNGEVLGDIGFELAGNALLAVATYNVAAASEFPLCGFTGIAMVFHRLFHLPIGMTVLVLNILPALLCMKIIGRDFILKTLRCMVISTLFMDYLAPMLPVYTGDRIIAAIVTGVLYGFGYSLIYIRGSSTGGSDFVMILIKSWRPHVNTGFITFALDFGVVVATGLIFRDIDGIFLGIIINYLMAAIIDKTISGMNSGNVALIVTNRTREIVGWIRDVSERGCTIFEARGGYRGEARDVVMVAGNNRDIYKVRREVKVIDPGSFVIIIPSNAVEGEGFKITRIAGE